jgi:SAM-dependent methyltransferase
MKFTDGASRVEGAYYRNPRSEMLAFLPENRRRVLEVGCGVGAFISSITGCEEKWGIEPTAAGGVAEPSLTKLLVGSFNEVKEHLPKRYFDLVICNDVIEHMTDHRAFLNELREYIAEGGMLIGSLPNVCFYDTLFRAIFENDWQYVEAGILDRTHIAFFTTKSFRKILEETGYSVVRMQGIFYDYKIAGDKRTRFYRLLAKIAGKITMGRLSHMRHFQFGFQAVPMVIDEH